MLSPLDNSKLFPIALGGAAIGSDEKNTFFGRTISEITAVETVMFALNRGINLIDTSPFYGSSEKRIGIAIKKWNNRKTFILSTKVGTHPQFKGYSAEAFKKSIDVSLKTLGTDYLDIVHIHDPTTADLSEALAKGGGMETLLKMKEEKIIRYIGLGVRNLSLHLTFIRSGFADVILPYLDYNLLRTNAKKLINEAHKKNIAVLLGSPLCMGLLSGRNPATITVPHYDLFNNVSISDAIRLYEWCQKKNINVMALNYAFIFSNPGVTCAVAGASSPAEVEENLKAYNESCSQEIVESFFNELQPS